MRAERPHANYWVRWELVAMQVAPHRQSALGFEGQNRNQGEELMTDGQFSEIKALLTNILAELQRLRKSETSRPQR